MQWTVQNVRQQFLDFFNSKGHAIVPSAPMVIKNDPTLMFTNAGMNQFKDIFLGNSKPTQVRVTDTQKCLRVSGKHNDLEEVGVDTYHHTMFEMLGNWSFGDYFKEESIEWAWELLTEVYKLDKSRLYITVFGGDNEDKVEEDSEAYNIWKGLVPEDQILKCGKKDNFWEMGETGPCGPCSEIHYDMRSYEEREWRAGKELVNEDHPQVIEIWNLVFIQYNRQSDRALTALPQKHVDTGMGLERLVRALQSKQSNYDTDVFTPLINAIAKRGNTTYGGSARPACVATRVIADHVRAVTFAIADGQLPSNTGAGYVIRRILRRAVRYAFSFLDLKEPFLYELVDVLQAEMGTAFPELMAQGSIAKQVIHEEEIAFLRTLDNGIGRFNDYLKTKPEQVDGDIAFNLFHTYGFPLDLTQLMAREAGIEVDEAGFTTAMEAAKAQSREGAATETGDWVELLADDVEEFIGYDYLEANVRITRYRAVKAKDKQLYQLVFNVTPFYAESGGQVGDTGYIEANGAKTSILDTKKENNVIIHLVNELPAEPKATFKAVVPADKRTHTNNNHSATHLLHHALRTVLGTHVEQKGSLVNAKHLRFDFSHFSKVTSEELIEVEKLVNRMIRANLALDEQRTVPFDKAKEMGAMALFGEKYGDVVRVIRFGDSVELCGGTHVAATGQIGLFKIIHETAVAAGIRRIEAITSERAEAYVYDQMNTLHEVKSVMKNPPDLLKAINSLLADHHDLSKKLEAVNREKAGDVKQDLLGSKEAVNGLNFIGCKVDLDAKQVKDLAFQLKGDANTFVVLGSNAGGKASITIAISDDLVKDRQLNAGQMIREVAKAIQGGGGGQPFLAQAGGKNPEGLDDAIAKAKELVSA